MNDLIHVPEDELFREIKNRGYLLGANFHKNDIKAQLFHLGFSFNDEQLTELCDAIEAKVNSDTGLNWDIVNDAINEIEFGQYWYSEVIEKIPNSNKEIIIIRLEFKTVEEARNKQNVWRENPNNTEYVRFKIHTSNKPLVLIRGGEKVQNKNE